MKLTALAFAALAAFAPAAAFAGCSGHSDQAASCAMGYVWSSAAGACVATSS